MYNQPNYRNAVRAVENGQRFLQPDCRVTFPHQASGVVHCRITIAGQRTEWSTRIKVLRADFNGKTQVIKADPRNTARLQALKADILRVFTDRELTGRSLKGEVIRDIVLGLRGHDELIPTVLEVIERYHQRQEERIGNNGLTLSSLSRYRTYRQRLATFIAIQYGPKIQIHQLKPIVGTHLSDYLSVQMGFDHNYCIKIIGYMKAILEYAHQSEWTDRNVLRGFKLRKFKKEVRLLSMDDLTRLHDAPLINNTANLVRDMFLFCAYTGLAYADMKKLNRGDVITLNGREYLKINRQKSAQQAFVPLFPAAKAILAKYQNHERCLMENRLIPTVTNQKANQWLKVIGPAAGIKEKLHTHMGRKTFTMYAEELGFTLNDTATMLGHTMATMTEQHYFKHRREPIIRKFESLFEQSENAQKVS